MQFVSVVVEKAISSLEELNGLSPVNGFDISDNGLAIRFFVDVVFVLKLLLLFAVDSMSGSYAKVFIQLWTFMAQVNKTPLICRIIYAGWHFYKLIDLVGMILS